MRSEDATSRTAATRLVAAATLALLAGAARAQPVGYGHSLPTRTQMPVAQANSLTPVAAERAAPASRPGLIRPAGLRSIPGGTPVAPTSPPAAIPARDPAETHVGTIHVRGPIADPSRGEAAVGAKPVTVTQLMNSFGGLAADADGGFYVYPAHDGKRSATYHIYEDGGIELSAGDVIVFTRDTNATAATGRSAATVNHAAGLAATRAAAATAESVPTVRVLHVGTAERLSGFLARHGYAGLPREAFDVVRPGGIETVAYEPGADPVLEPGSTIVIKPRHYWSRDVVTAEAGTAARIASPPAAVGTPMIPAPAPAPAMPAAATPIAVTEVLGRADGRQAPPALFGPRLGPTDRDEPVDRAGSAGPIAIEPAGSAGDDLSAEHLAGRPVASADASVLRPDAVVEDLPPPPIDGPGVLAWRSPPTLGPPAETQIADADTNGAEPIEAIALAGAADDDVASVANAGPSATLLIFLSLPFVAAVGALAWLAGVRFLVGGETERVGLSAAEDVTEADASPVETVTAADNLTTETTPVESDPADFELTETESAEFEPENTEIVAPAAMPEPIEVAPADRPAPLADDGSPAPVDDEFHDETLRRLLRDDFPVEIEPVRLPASLRLFGRSPGLARLRVDAAASPTARGPHFAKKPAAMADISPAAAVTASSPNAALVDAILRQAGLGTAGPAERTHTPS